MRNAGLMHGRDAPGTQGDLRSQNAQHVYATEDVNSFVKRCDLLGFASYHVVVGNPPYIAVRDKSENERYREGYNACSGTYALSVPFAQRMFHLAIRRDGSERDAGYVGQITANSFMKREFGKKLIENFFQTVHLTQVIDTSGAYIPGHGTPTVILVGRNHFWRENDPIRAVLGVRGEPVQPPDPADGLVWSAIVDQIGSIGSESAWVSVEDLDRKAFGNHPWSLAGGGATPVVAALENTSQYLKYRVSKPIGRAIRAGADEAYMRPLRPTLRTTAESEALRPLMIGEVVRNWHAAPEDRIWYPYSANLTTTKFEAELWAWRTQLAERRTFQGNMADADLRWWEYMQHTMSAYTTQLSIVFSFVSTHNHFVLDRGGKVFKQSAPVIKLPEGASEDDHLALLGVLNSSTACFWLKQVSYPKGGDPVGDSGARVSAEAWSDRYEFTGTKLQEFPLPAELPLEFGRELDSLAQELAGHEPSAVAAKTAPTRERLDAARAEHGRIRGQMIALQEELDWTVYHSYGLLNDAELAQLTASDHASVPKVVLGERAFEIVLARKVAAREAETAWFERHGSTPVTEIPAHWPEWYRQIVQARIETIENRRDIALIERPECKRRWASEPWEKKEAEALRTWLLDRCERRDLWFSMREGLSQPRTLTVNQLADRFRDDADMHAVASLYASDHLGKPDLTLAGVLERVVADQHVPFLAAMRYKDSGLRKRAQWEWVWEQQREEDRTGERLDIPVPEKYKSADFRKPSYWSQRGKLDVPKERFISYPEAGLDSDPSMLLGWAGWDHKDQAQALVNIVNDRTSEAGWGTKALTPVVAGLAEVMPWVKQWHGEYDDEWGGVPAEEYQAFLADQRAKHHLTEDDLKEWRPAPARRGKKGKQ